jgi:hypothetical protein
MARTKLRGSILTLASRAREAGRAAAQEVLDKVVRGVVEEARSRWPRDTGASAAALGVEQRGDTKVAAVGRADYTTIIVSRLRGHARRPWQGLVVLQLDRALQRGTLGTKLAKAISSRLRVRR